MTAGLHLATVSRFHPSSHPLLRIPIGQEEDEFESIRGNNAANLVIVESPAKAKTIQKYLRPWNPIGHL